MDKLTFLFLAYAAIWTGLFLFLLQIARKLSQQQRDLVSLREELNR